MWWWYVDLKQDKVLSIKAMISSYLSVILLTSSRYKFLYLALTRRYCKSTPPGQSELFLMECKATVEQQAGRVENVQL